MNVGLAITRNAVKRPDSPAVIGETPLTYSELDKTTNRIANLVAKKYGLKPGERIAVLLANRSEIVELLGGVAKGGYVYVGLNFRLGSVELQQIFENAEPALVITDTEHSKQLEPVVEKSVIPIIDIDEPEWRSTLDSMTSEAPPTLHATRSDDDFCIVYTSGTTGRPKGVLFDHNRSLHHALVTCLEYEINHESRYLIQIPHNSSVNITIVPCLIAGASLGFEDSRNFDPINYAQKVEHLGITHSFLVPTQLMRLLDRLPENSDHQLTGLITLGYGSSPISPDRLRELVRRFGPIFNQLYGMAEIASIGTILSKEDHIAGLNTKPELLASCGRPSYGVDVQVVDSDKNPVDVGSRGEVIFAGPHVMKCYYRDEDRTQEVLIDGWMHSGDVAVLDPEGYIYIVDRLKNLIIRGGLNIAPTEIENVLYRHPAVLEASVVGAPDPDWGEAIIAFVALREGLSIDTEDLRLHCRQSELTSIKIPERIEIIDSLPKNAVGKIDKQALRDQLWGDGRKV